MSTPSKPGAQQQQQQPQKKKNKNKQKKPIEVQRRSELPLTDIGVNLTSRQLASPALQDALIRRCSEVGTMWTSRRAASFSARNMGLGRLCGSWDLTL